ncbi:unnamed protein product [Acanthoscelides obtectus]|uniref:Ig-like domain-containing protein n=1 Tax=Acanthoscelides obtectus TaxID=200917 RepID=A0A9P0PSS7_ACAOB|nr:unnamed protein product [Acanthoscelides obtectus]CAK1650047.1 Inactive tyrosine-protein kinase 7 [Acanthoscelides obtectus]
MTGENVGKECAVHAKEDPFFSKSPKDVEVVLGQSATLPCEVTPNIGIAYYWELNGSKISDTTRRYQQGGDLYITRVDRERDAGQFRCVAEKVGGGMPPIVSSPATINIQCE